MSRSRGGFGSKIHLVTYAGGIPLAAEVTAEQTHDSTRLEGVMGAVRSARPIGRQRTRPAALAGDKAYDLPGIRQWLRRRGIGAVIPEKRKPHGRKPGRSPEFNAAK
ncbi:MAG: transposase [Planctomycetota bacterium]|nr:transposase [Planctomycetota bacterium]